MLHDLAYFKPYVCFDFQIFSIYDQYMYYYLPIHQILRLSNFLEVSKLVLAQYDRTCPTPLPDISGQTYLETLS
jgi:hypothetical protein